MQMAAPPFSTPNPSGHRKAGWPRRVLLLGLLTLLLLPLAAFAAQFSEYEIKAGFLYNFMNFVTWAEPPEGAGNQMVVAVLDTGAIGKTIAEALAQESVHGKTIRVLQTTQPSDARKAHLLFVPASYAGDLTKLFQAIQGRPILTVGESPAFIAAGGMINFVRQGAKVRFEIHPHAAQMAGLKISSQLLRLAIITESSHILQFQDHETPERGPLAKTLAAKPLLPGH